MPHLNACFDKAEFGRKNQVRDYLSKSKNSFHSSCLFMKTVDHFLNENKASKPKL